MKKMVLGLLACVLCIALIAGCGQKASTEKKTDSGDQKKAEET
jgi:uncharacterized lipoprotein